MPIAHPVTHGHAQPIVSEIHFGSAGAVRRVRGGGAGGIDLLAGHDEAIRDPLAVLARCLALVPAPAAERAAVPQRMTWDWAPKRVMRSRIFSSSAIPVQHVSIRRPPLRQPPEPANERG
jgi:hypothetical protein